MDIVTGDWRPLDLEAVPLKFPLPVEIIIERLCEYGGDAAGKSPALWRREPLPIE